MRRLLLAAAFFAVAQTASAASIAVHIDQSTRLSLPGAARDILVGNPAIADVTLLSPTSLAIQGKSYGVTNLVVIDGAGRTILQQQVVVSAPDENRITMFRGPNVANYACAPRCERTSGAGESGAPASAPASTSN